MFRWLKGLFVLREIRRNRQARAVLAAAHALSWRQRTSFTPPLSWRGEFGPERYVLYIDVTPKR